MVEKKDYIGGWNKPLKEREETELIHIDDFFPTDFGISKKRDKNAKRN